jgi:outer membrane immunogenic protein
MRLVTFVAAAGVLAAAPAFAQDAGQAAPADPAAATPQSTPATDPMSTTTTDQSTTSYPAASDNTSSQTGSSSDGSKLFGFVPYVGVMGGWEQFDNERNKAGIPQVLNPNGTVRRNYKLAGSLVQGVVGANLPLGPVFVGVEGNVAKGVSGDIDWEYGVAGRAGFRAGDSGLLYGKVGYQWVNFDRFGNDSPDYHDWEYGVGFEVGPKDIGLSGLTNRAGLRLRGEVSTFGSTHSFRPMAGIIAHF